MKWIKRCGGIILSLPIALAAVWGGYQIFGMYANHSATGEQTAALQANLRREISDVEIISVYSETGNTSGTGNHVDCLSSVIFSTEMQKAEIESCLSQYYVFDGWSRYVSRAEDGNYVIYINTQAPFADNIEGH